MRKRIWIFAIVLGCLSGFCAESSIGSSPWLFYTPWGLLVTLPIYALHVLILTRVVTMKGPPKLYILYAAGAIFGLYEAYITKMIFFHEWGPLQLSFVGVSWFALPILVFWYHPIFAFIIPVFAVELFVVGNRKGQAIVPERLREWVRRRPFALPALWGVWMGLYHSANPAGWVAVAAAASDGAFILLIVWIGRKVLAGSGDGICGLIPRGRAWKVLLSALLLIFLVFGFGIRPEALPDLAGYVTIGCCYVIYAVVIWTGLDRIRPIETDPDYEPPLLQIRHFVCALSIWLALMIGTTALPRGIGMGIFYLDTLMGYGLGFVLVIWMFVSLYRDRLVSSS